MTLISKAKILLSAKDNLFSSSKTQLFYVSEMADWVVSQIGKSLTKNFDKLGLIKARTTTSYLGIRNRIIHFGSINTFLNQNGFHKPHKSNKIVVSWFHVVPSDPRIKFIKEAQKYVNLFHTSCNITKNHLVQIGVPQEKIIVIPLGVDLNLFNPVSINKRQKLRQELNIPKGKIVIGSFQKDGAGWGRGLEPKLIKGPDIFVKVEEKLSEDYPIFVLLVGPARGYIESNLKKRNIPFKSIGFVKDSREIAKYYQALDLYLITSRIEGGPKQILEAIASGIPVVSTGVGMVPDIVEDGREALLAGVEDIHQIVNKAEEVISSEELRKKLVKNGLKAAQNYSWEKISKRYYEKIYSKLL